MKNFIARTGFPTIFLLAFAVALLNSCAGSMSSGYGESGNSDRGGYLSLFLNLKENPSPPVLIELQSIDILDDSGSWHPLELDAATVNASAIGAGQVFLARGRLQPGNYSRIRFTLQGSSLQQKRGPVDLQMKETATEVTVPQLLNISDGDSHSFFLTWDVSASLQENLNFDPVFQVAPRLRNLIVDAAYVSCPDINTVFMIRTDKNWVYDSLGVDSGPTYLFSSPIAPADNLFAVTGSEPGVKRIGPSSNRVTEDYRLPMAGSSSHMALDPDGRLAYIVDSRRGYVMRLNLDTGHIEQRLRIGYEPGYIIYLEKQKLLAVSLSLSQRVILLNPQTLATVNVVDTANRPEGMMVLNGSLLYIAESGSNSVLVYDLDRNMIWKRIPVDFSPRRILAADGYIYIANDGSRSISLLLPGQLGVSRNITMSGAPLELADVPSSRWIYVGNEGNNSITIIDPVTNRIVNHIQLGARPGGIAVINR